jgi:hypothetical protein
MVVISFSFRVSIRSEKYSNHSAVRLRRSEFETTLNSRKTGFSETTTPSRELVENPTLEESWFWKQLRMLLLKHAELLVSHDTAVI